MKQLLLCTHGCVVAVQLTSWEHLPLWGSLMSLQILGSHQHFLRPGNLTSTWDQQEHRTLKRLLSIHKPKGLHRTWIYIFRSAKTQFVVSELVQGLNRGGHGERTNSKVVTKMTQDLTCAFAMRKLLLGNNFVFGIYVTTTLLKRIYGESSCPLRGTNHVC